MQVARNQHMPSSLSTYIILTRLEKTCHRVLISFTITWGTISHIETYRHSIISKKFHIVCIGIDTLMEIDFDIRLFYLFLRSDRI